MEEYLERGMITNKEKRYRPAGLSNLDIDLGDGRAASGSASYTTSDPSSRGGESISSDGVQIPGATPFEYLDSRTRDDSHHAIKDSDDC